MEEVLSLNSAVEFGRDGVDRLKPARPGGAVLGSMGLATLLLALAVAANAEVLVR